MANLFNSVKIKNPKRNKFNLSHSVRLTTEFGRITPIMCEPVLPADKFNVSSVLKIQFAPMTFPVMERFKAYIHYWYVPNRILWDNWEEFITGGETGVEDLAHPYPFIEVSSADTGEDGNVLLSNFGNGSLFDYLGFPAKDMNEQERWSAKQFDALPFKAYQLIYDEFYRDQNLEGALDIHTEKDGKQDFDDDGATINGLMSLRYRAWRKDYFTSAMPDPQRGPDVTLPFFSDIDIEGSGTTALSVNRIYNTETQQYSSMQLNTSGGERKFVATAQPAMSEDGDPITLSGSLQNAHVARNLSASVDSRSASINDVRRGFALQRLYELAARVGGRYAENIFGNFGVHAGDARLQRPEYLGGSSVPIYVGDVLQTSESTEGGTPLGMPAGVAGAMGSCKEFSRSFSEHGWIIGVLTIMPEASYIQGIPRKFLKRDRLDFAWPLLANLGEQEIESQELYFDFGATDEENKQGFGYTPRYAEYKFGLNSIHGDFRSSLADFHDARVFSSRPALNHEFVTVKPTSTHEGLNRIFAVNDADYDHLWVNLYNNVVVRRKLPKYGTPI